MCCVEYAAVCFFHSYPTSGLLFNCVLCFNTIDGATDNLQYCFDNAVSQMPFNTFKCTKRTTAAYGTVQYMDQQTAGKKEGKRRGVYSTNFIQFQPHHLHIYVESGISRWRNTRGLRHLLSLGQIRLFSQISSVPNTGVRAIY